MQHYFIFKAILVRWNDSTQLVEGDTWAVSLKKAIANARYQFMKTGRLQDLEIIQVTADKPSREINLFEEAVS